MPPPCGLMWHKTYFPSFFPSHMRCWSPQTTSLLLKIGDGIDQPRVVLLQQWLHLLHLHPPGIRWAADQLEMMRTKEVKRPIIGRTLHEHGITGLEEELGN